MRQRRSPPAAAAGEREVRARLGALAPLWREAVIVLFRKLVIVQARASLARASQLLLSASRGWIATAPAPLPLLVLQLGLLPLALPPRQRRRPGLASADAWTASEPPTGSRCRDARGCV
jgi:hypothetical protein